MNDVRVITNNHIREIVDACELTVEERDEYDFLDWKAIEDGTDSASFFRYRGDVHFLGDFLRWDGFPESPLKEWDGYNPDSFFSGLVVKYVNDDNGDGIRVGRYVF